MPDTPGVVLVVPLLGMPEVAEGDDLAALLLRACAHTGLCLQPGDVVVVSSKIASKSLGLWASDREDAVAASTGRVVAERALLDDPAVGGPAPSGTAPPGPPSSRSSGDLADSGPSPARPTPSGEAPPGPAPSGTAPPGPPSSSPASGGAARSPSTPGDPRPGRLTTRIVEAAAGPVMAAGGVDASNTGGRAAVLLLPPDPDAVARSVLDDLLRASGLPDGSLGVILSDTAGRPWRVGQVDFALGSAGFGVLDDLRGGSDADGRPLAVTARAVADEVASAADLVKGKAHAVPAAVVRGLGHLVSPDRASARSLIRTGPGDWFRLGHVEAVRAALGVEPGSPDASAVGIPSVGPEAPAERVARAIRLALRTRILAGVVATVRPARPTLPDHPRPTTPPIGQAVTDGPRARPPADAPAADEPDATPPPAARTAPRRLMEGADQLAGSDADAPAPDPRVATVRLTSDNAYRLGLAVARLDVALWAEDLRVESVSTSTGRVDVTVWTG